jgi:ABC-2 type transport system permease protein
MFFWMITWVAKGSSNYFLVQITSFLSMVSHFETLAKGILSVSDMVFYASFLGINLFITQKVLASRNW